MLSSNYNLAQEEINPQNWIVTSDTSVSQQRILFQESTSILEEYLENNELTNEIKGFIRAKSFWQARGIDESISQISPQKMYSKAMQVLITDYDCTNDWMNDNYEFVGPYFGEIGQNAGRFDAVWSSMNDQDFILAGSRGGGIFKTTNGGASWVNVTENNNFPGFGITNFEQDLDNPNVFYASTGNFIDGSNYGVGIIKSEDNGDT